MAGDESGSEKSPLDRLREIFTEEEIELLLKGVTEQKSASARSPGEWRPPTQKEFDEEWITPLDALDVSDFRLADDDEVWSIMEQLKAGQIDAVARTAQSGSIISGVEQLVPVMPRHWRLIGHGHEERFFKKGNLVVPVLNAMRGHTGNDERFFDIRFNPASFSGGPPSASPLETAILAPHKGIPIPEEPIAVRGKEISTDDATRFAQAIMAGWPEATEVFAHGKALAFFPENKVPREWFLRIFRSIRGDKKRGPQPKIRF